MSERIWDFEDLVRFTKWDDPEVRYWAIDRLVRHYPDACCDAIAGFLLDDHEVTPSVVARHLGEHGDASHHPILLRGFRLLRGLTPGFCLQALARLGYPGLTDLARSALQRGDLTDPALAIIAEALSDLGTPQARQVVREYVDRKVELLSEPGALHAALRVSDSSELPDVLGRYLTALQWRGGHRAGEGMRTLMDALQIDDAGWCFRTGPSGRIELRKTIKAVESGYDCDILAAMGEGTIKQIAHKFRAGDLGDIVRSIAEWTRSAVAKLPEDPEDELPERMAAAVGAFTNRPVVDDVEKLGHQFQQWVLGFQLSAAFSVARYSNVELALKRARGDLESLLALAERETAFLLPDLPAAIAVVCRDDEDRSRRAQDWCLRMLESQGPFFPKVVALETLGELGAMHFIPEIMEYLSDENSYVYGAAERALSKMGDALIQPAVTRLENGLVDPESAYSLLVLLCDLGSPAAYEAVVRHLDFFMEEIGPGSATEWVSLFGTEELIDPLRDWLDDDPVLVGQGLLLLGAIHNVRIPEEDDILQAIEDERERQQGEDADDDTREGSEGSGGEFVM
jgi:HEAT repeat protein